MIIFDKKIQIENKYKTFSGLMVELESIDDNIKYYPVAGFIKIKNNDGQPAFKARAYWNEYGKYMDDRGSHDYDLVEISSQDEKYSNIKKDHPGWARDLSFSRIWYPCHFAGISKDGKPMVWPMGITSHTAALYNIHEPVIYDEFCINQPG